MFVCKAGYSGWADADTCTACPLHQYKADAGDAVGCSACPTGATTTSTGSTSAGDCTCQANSQLNAAGDTCECVAGHYQGPGGACAACGAGTYKAAVGNAGCDPCPDGSGTASQGATSPELRVLHPRRRVANQGEKKRR